MRDEVLRRPGAVADDDGTAATGPTGFGTDPGGAEVRRGVDTDDDGAPDTLLAVDGADLLVLTDLDDDGLADRVLRLGPDGSVHADLGDDPAAPLAGSAPAHGLWSALLGRLLGPDA